MATLNSLFANAAVEADPWTASSAEEAVAEAATEEAFDPWTAAMPETPAIEAAPEADTVADVAAAVA